MARYRSVATWGMFPSPLGALHAAAMERGVCALSLSARDAGEWAAWVARKSGRPVVEGSNAVLEQLREELERYFAGALREFETPLDPLWGTPLQRGVWEALGTIPHGQVRSYRWVADVIERPTAARAVGGAVGANPIGIVIPCHRVIASDGSLGGFGAGLACKRALLQTEGVILRSFDKLRTQDGLGSADRLETAVPA